MPDKSSTETRFPLPEERKAQYLEQEIRQHIPQGTKLTTPPCAVFDRCGGCQLQHIPFDVQGIVKKNQLEAIFQKAGVDLKIPVENTRTDLNHVLNYRNKADFTARTWDEKVHLGFTPYGGKGALVEAEHCPIALPVVNKTLNAVRESVGKVKELQKRLVSVTIRGSLGLDESFLLFHSKHKDPQVYLDITKEAMESVSEIKGGTFIKKRREYTQGSSLITEKIKDLEFSYNVRTFFQANVHMIETLVDTVAEVMESVPRKDVLLDIYCGVGLFALNFAKEFKEVYGIESTPASIDMARHNMEANGFSGIPFYRDTAEERLHKLLATGIYPDVIILDPPRSGLHKNVIASLIGLKPSPTLILVSCNPVSLAENVKDLKQGGYVLERMIPVDMFPQTEHLEVVARMTRKDRSR